MQLNPQPGRLVDEPKILAEQHHQPQLRITDVWRGIEAAIASAQDDRRCRLQRLVRNKYIDVLAATQAQIAEGQHSKRWALHKQDWQISLIEQAL